MAQLTVILCKKCGTRNEATAEFCGGCGSFLEFTGQKIDDATGAPAVSTPQVASAARPPAPPPPPPAVSSAAAASPSAGPPAVSPLAAHATPPAVRPDAPHPAQPLEPAQRRPTDPVPHQARPQPLAPPSPVLVAKPGDVICAHCGNPNDPSRHFCRICGRSLIAEAPIKKDPWWRRFFKKREPVVAGTRTQQQTRTSSGGAGFGRTFKSIFALVVFAIMTFGLAGYVAVPSLRATINNTIKDVQRNFVQPAHVYPTGAAGDSIADHPPELAVDKTHNLFWAGPTSGSLPKLDFTFTAATDIVAVIVTPGAEDDLASFARPRELRFTFSDGTVLDATLQEASLVDPTPGQGTGKVLAYQSFTTNAREITGVTVDVLSVYPGTRPAVAIAEIEFFTKP